MTSMNGGLMTDRVILNNQVAMPLVGFGTWDLRGDSGKRAILNALETGYRLIDTAQMYDNESVVGQAAQESGIAREEIFITTKVWGSKSFAQVVDSVKESLDRLQTDYADLVLIHEPYANALEMYEALTELHRQGVIRAIGVSNFNQKQFHELVKHCEVIPAVNQVESHLFYPQLELQSWLSDFGTHMQSWAPFTEGRRDIFNNTRLIAIAEKYEKTAAQIALHYLVQNGIAVIPKSSNPERIRENFALLDFELNHEDMCELAKFNEHRSLFNWY